MQWSILNLNFLQNFGFIKKPSDKTERGKREKRRCVAVNQSINNERSIARDAIILSSKINHSMHRIAFMRTKT